MGDKLRICRNPACLTPFDPDWRVRLVTDPPEADNLCPACGLELDRNLCIRKEDHEQTDSSG